MHWLDLSDPLKQQCCSDVSGLMFLSGEYSQFTAPHAALFYREICFMQSVQNSCNVPSDRSFLQSVPVIWHCYEEVDIFCFISNPLTHFWNEEQNSKRIRFVFLLKGAACQFGLLWGEGSPELTMYVFLAVARHSSLRVLWRGGKSQVISGSQFLQLHPTTSGKLCHSSHYPRKKFCCGCKF